MELESNRNSMQRQLNDERKAVMKAEAVAAEHASHIHDLTDTVRAAEATLRTERSEKAAVQKHSATLGAEIIRLQTEVDVSVHDYAETRASKAGACN
jgi:hypothetical protein